MATTQGPSAGFYDRVQIELQAQGISLRELVSKSGVNHTSIAALRTSGFRDRATRQRNVLALAEVLNIPRDEALQLAGLASTPTDPAMDSIEAIRRDPRFTEEQRAALIHMAEILLAGSQEHDTRHRAG